MEDVAVSVEESYVDGNCIPNMWIHWVGTM